MYVSSKGLLHGIQKSGVMHFAIALNTKKKSLTFLTLYWSTYWPIPFISCNTILSEILHSIDQQAESVDYEGKEKEDFLLIKISKCEY